MTELRKVKEAYDILQTAGWRALLLSISMFIARNPRSNYSREHIRYLHKSKNLRVAEIGVWEGRHAEILQRQLDIEKMYLIDPYDAYEDYEESKSDLKKMQAAKEESRRRLQEYSNLEWIELYSHQAAQQIGEQLDYIYIDGNHEYDYVKRDIEVFYDLLKPGGVIAGDDFNASWPGVVKAVTEFADENDIEAHTEPYGSDWWLVKPR